jgi:hypothetical protein
MSTATQTKLKMPEHKGGTFDVKPTMPFTVVVIKSHSTVKMPKMSLADAEREAKWQRAQGFVVEIVESTKLATTPTKVTIPPWITGE